MRASRILIIIVSLFISVTSYAQDAYNPTRVDNWAKTLIDDINAQISDDRALLKRADLKMKYNQLAASSNYLPDVTAYSPEVQEAYEREEHRNDDCFDGVIARRLKETTRNNCDVNLVASVCEESNQFIKLKLKNSAESRKQFISSQNAPSAIEFARELRVTLIRDVKSMIKANNRCSDAAGEFQRSAKCMDTHREVFEPIRGLIKSTCTVKAVEEQVEDFKFAMSNPTGDGYADKYYQTALKHIESRKMEVELAQHLQNIHGFIQNYENGTRAPTSSKRPELRPAKYESQVCDINDENSNCSIMDGQ